MLGNLEQFKDMQAMVAAFGELQHSVGGRLTRREVNE